MNVGLLYLKFANLAMFRGDNLPQDLYQAKAIHWFLTIPFLGASGSSVHFAGIHFGTELHVPLLQMVVRLVVGWNCDRHWTDIDWLWPMEDPLALSATKPWDM